MTASTPRSEFLAGFRHSAPFLLVVSPFGMLFGVVATEAGLPLLQVMVMTSLVIAGASQFTALQLMTDNAGVAMASAAALAINLRMAMYSASLVPHLGGAPLWTRALIAYLNFDQSATMSIARFEARPELTMPAKIAYFFGIAVPMSVLWVASTAFGALVGTRIPDALALDFALPITFLALVAPLLKSLAHVAAAATSVVLALAFAGLPAGTGLLLAAAAAMLTGALVETALERRR